MVFGLVYGYGQLCNGRIDGQTTGRCEKALELYRKGKIQKIFITVSAKKRGIYMGQGMKQFFLDQKVPEVDIVFEPIGRNTAGETDAFLTLARYHNNYKTPRAIAVSTWYHTPRIWWLWLTRMKFVKVGISWKEAHWADLRIEPVKMLNALLRPHSSSKMW